MSKGEEVFIWVAELYMLVHILFLVSIFYLKRKSNRLSERQKRNKEVYSYRIGLLDRSCSDLLGTLPSYEEMLDSDLELIDENWIV